MPSNHIKTIMNIIRQTRYRMHREYEDSPSPVLEYGIASVFLSSSSPWEVKVVMLELVSIGPSLAAAGAVVVARLESGTPPSVILSLFSNSIDTVVDSGSLMTRNGFGRLVGVSLRPRRKLLRDADSRGGEEELFGDNMNRFSWSSDILGRRSGLVGKEAEARRFCDLSIGGGGGASFMEVSSSVSASSVASQSMAALVVVVPAKRSAGVVSQSMFRGLAEGWRVEWVVELVWKVN